MATRNIVLTDQQEDLVQRLVAAGRYQNASEALRAGLLEAEEQAALDLRSRLVAGLEQAAAGDLAPGSGADAIRRAFARARQAQ